MLSLTKFMCNFNIVRKSYYRNSYAIIMLKALQPWATAVFHIPVDTPFTESVVPLLWLIIIMLSSIDYKYMSISDKSRCIIKPFFLINRSLNLRNCTTKKGIGKH